MLKLSPARKIKAREKDRERRKIYREKMSIKIVFLLKKLFLILIY
jgi:hypothetical protein